MGKSFPERWFDWLEGSAEKVAGDTLERSRARLHGPVGMVRSHQLTESRWPLTQPAEARSESRG